MPRLVAEDDPPKDDDLHNESVSMKSRWSSHSITIKSPSKRSPNPVTISGSKGHPFFSPSDGPTVRPGPLTAVRGAERSSQMRTPRKGDGPILGRKWRNEPRNEPRCEPRKTWRNGGDFTMKSGDFMGFWWDWTRTNRDLIGKYADLMGFYWNWWWYLDISMGFDQQNHGN